MKKKSINRPEFENSPEMLEEISFRINSFMIHQLEKTNDISVQSSIKAQLHKQLSVLDKLEQKLIRNEKKEHETALQQISKIKNQLFPNNILQERYDNFIPLYLKHGDNFIEILKENLNPLNPNFVVLTL